MGCYQKILLLYALLFVSINNAQISRSVEQEIPITIIIVSNAITFLDQNLSMCLKQQYDNFRIIYVADGLCDWQYHVLEHWVACHDTHKRITLMRNKTPVGTLSALWHIIHTAIDDDEIVLYMNPNDWFASKNVLKQLNAEYAPGQIWLTYSQYYSFPLMNIGKNSPLSPCTLIHNSWRHGSLLQKYSRCCSFYAGLFKQIKIDDLLYKNMFFMAGAENAFIYPLLEMARTHVRYINEPLYVYNQETDRHALQKYLYLFLASARYIQHKQPYAPLSLSPTISSPRERTADLIIFSFNRPMQLYALLESLEKHVSNIGNISVIYRVSNDQFMQGYAAVKKRFAQVNFILQQTCPDNTFKEQLMDLLHQASPYVMFGVDDIMVKEPFDIAECINWLEKTGAYGFYLRLGTNIQKCYFQAAPINADTSIKPYTIVNDRVCVWQFMHGSHDWKYPNTLDMTIYRKKEIIPTIAQLDFQTPNMLEGLWHGTTEYRGTGICFLKSNVVNLPLNMVQDDMFFNPRTIDIPVEKLLLFFLEGLKIDIDCVQHIENPSAHIDFIPPMVIRNE